MDQPQTRELLAHAVGFPTVEKLTNIAHLYSEQPDRLIVGIEAVSQLAGLIGVALEPSGTVEILHIAVIPQRRGIGIGRQLIDEIIHRTKAHTLTAETDSSAVGFYRRLGFEVETLGSERYGVERFRCTLVCNAEPA